MKKIRMYDMGTQYILGEKFFLDYGNVLMALSLMDMESLKTGRLLFRVMDEELPGDGFFLTDDFEKAARALFVDVSSYTDGYLQAVEKVLLGEDLERREKSFLMPTNVRIEYGAFYEGDVDMASAYIHSLQELVFADVMNMRVFHLSHTPKYGKCEVCGRIFRYGTGRGSGRKYCPYINLDGVSCSEVARLQKVSAKHGLDSEYDKFTKGILDRIRKQETRNGWPYGVREELQAVAGTLTEIHQGKNDIEGFKEALLRWYRGKQKEYKSLKKQ